MNVIIFMGGFLIGLVITLVVVEYRTSQDIANLIKIIREQSEFIDKLNQSAKDLGRCAKDNLTLSGDLIETCKEILSVLPQEDQN